MDTGVPQIRRRAASQDTTPSLPVSQSSDVGHAPRLKLATWTDLRQSSRDSETTAPGKVRQVIACCRRHIERFAGAPRSAVHADEQSVNSSSCFELRRPKSYSLPMHLPSQTQPRRTRTNRPRPLNMEITRQQSYQFYMDEDNHPFITTPSCIEEDNSPKLTAFVTPPSR
jgi:hypothetical protein